MRISRSSRVLALTMLVGLVAAACGGDGNDAATPDQNATGATATGASGSTGDDAGRYGGMGEDETGATGGRGDDGASSDAPVVQANNFSFDPSELEVASGSTITVKNGNANTPHTFTVEDTDIDIEALLALRAKVAGWLDGETLRGALWQAGLPATFARGAALAA